MADPFSAYAGIPDGPARAVYAVTPSDGVDLTTVARALYIGVSGDVTLIAAGDTVAVLFTAVPVGILPVSAKRVKATGTTATGIVALT